MKHRSILAVLLLLLAGMAANAPPLGAAGGDEPIAGIHTIRASDDLLQVAASSGFRWMVQLVEWREVEPVPGEFFWEYADWLVRATEYYGLDLVLRLDHAPDWATSSVTANPIDTAAYGRFVGQIAARYRGRVLAYIVWNEPNLALEWAEEPPDPAAYTSLLCTAHSAIQKADPEVLVISAGLAPTNHTDTSAQDDRLYLEAMYAAGAADCFDILAAHPYGFAYPPDDPYNAHDGLNFARLADLRRIMVARGDGNKPIWTTELGWTTDPVGEEQQWLRVSEEEQSRYLVSAFEQTAEEWSWLERIAIWNLSKSLPAEDEKRGFSILTTDGTPKPALHALAELARNRGNPAPEEPRNQRATPLSAGILAPDVMIRLSDPATFYPHWARPHCGSVPCRQWTGQFYIQDPGTEPWQLCMEVMQVEEPSNLVWINGQLLDPPALPLRKRPDFASVWTATEMQVPAARLRPGVNTIEIRSSPLLPVYQGSRARFESLQFRHIRLVRDL